MGGGLLQLVAYGAQDIYLTGNPQITFFKVVYRRHTNFAMEAIENVFNGSAGFGKRVTCQISRNGDLIHRMYVQVQLPPVIGSTQWVDYIGLRVLADVEIEIGGQRIDKHYSQWMYIWNELSLPVGKQNAWKKMVGSEGNNSPYVSGTTGYNCFVPLEFWFNRNVGLALPLIALQYHEVKVNIDFETLTNCIAYGTGNTATPTTSNAVSGDLVKSSIWVDYIYLDTDERRRFAQLSHEYLIEQLQFTGDETITGLSTTAATTARIKMNFNHPVKELIWVVQNDGRLGLKTDSTSTSNNWINFATDSPADTSGASTTNYGKYNSIDESAGTNIQLNGQDRFYAREGSYFNNVQPFQHHENCGGNPGINVYSFALKPEEHQPSGTLNFSRIDTAYLNLKLASVPTSLYAQNATTAKCKIYAVNYNVLRIMSGMGGLAYSN
jgi:Large eukaryotic DNA virus major capsid protein/Major capsid protein N-terminus